jgi:hypothetical protein
MQNKLIYKIGTKILGTKLLGTQLLGTHLLGASYAIAPLIQSITSLSASIYHSIGNLKITKNTHQQEILHILEKTDIEATIRLVQTIVQDISSLPAHLYFKEKFITIALTNVKDSIARINNELLLLKEKIHYNSTLYFFSSMRSYDLAPHLQMLDTAVLDRRCDYLFKCLDLCKHFAHAETPAVESGDAVCPDTV